MTTPVHITALIPEEYKGLRLDKALSIMFPQYSRTRLKDWLDQGLITLNQVILRPRDIIQGGETVVISASLEEKMPDIPENKPLNVVFEDEHFLIINKPAGWTVHPGKGNSSGTMANALLYHYPDLNVLPRAGIVHRLDKDTSGLMVVAKTLIAHTSLVSQLQARTVKRIYETVVVGVMTAGGTVKVPIGRHPKERTKMAVTTNGKNAVSH